MEFHVSFHPQDANEIHLNVRGASIVYDAVGQQVKFLDSTASAPLRNGSQELTIFVDRTSVEVFGDGGLVYIPRTFVPHANDHSVSVSVTGGAATIDNVDIYRLDSAWQQ